MVEPAGKAQLTLKTNDEKSIEVDRELWLKYAIASKAEIDDAPDQTELVMDISEKCVKHIVEFMTYLQSHDPPKVEKPLRTIHMKDNVNDPWYATYIEEPHTDFDMLQDLVNASNSLDFKELLTLSCGAMGSIVRQLRGDIKKFRQKFDIVNDFSPEEEADPYTPEKVVALAKAWEESQAKEGKKEEEEKKAE